MATETDAFAREGESDERAGAAARREWRSPSFVRMSVKKETENSVILNGGDDGTVDKS